MPGLTGATTCTSSHQESSVRVSAGDAACHRGGLNSATHLNRRNFGSATQSFLAPTPDRSRVTLVLKVENQSPVLKHFPLGHLAAVLHSRSYEVP